MENDLFNAAKSDTVLSSIAVNGTSSQIYSSHIHPQAFDLNIQNHIMSQYPVISSLQQQPADYEFRDSFAEGLPISCPVLATLLASRNSSVQQSSFDTTLNVGYDSVLGGCANNSRWDFDKFLVLPEIAAKTPGRSDFIPFRLVENVHSNGWISGNNTNELSLSLATTQPGMTDQCSDMTSIGRLSSDQTSSSNGRELSLSFGSYRPVRLPQVTSNFSYLNVIQEIFTEIASCSLDNFDHHRFSTRGVEHGATHDVPYFSSCFTEEYSSEDGRRQVQTEHIWQRQDIQSRKSHLLSLLQAVDERYNQCMDEIHTVISAFHAAMELNPQIHAHFALHTMSMMYKNLRERISTQILTMPVDDKGKCANEKEDISFIQKQWALQQLRRKEHQLWRPQRGLPERSVSVLRAWMFQNFLHPYPKDTEKHLLAVKSGLTRSQVSNWFINARVRLWKPMIEEMYSEMNRRKARSNDKADVNIGHENMDNNQSFKLI